MTNQQNPNPPTYSPSKSRPHTFVPNPDESEEQGKEQSSSGSGQPLRTNAGRVEIGEPVPEKDRETRASQRCSETVENERRGTGETGEDEDLPDADDRR